VTDVALGIKVGESGDVVGGNDIGPTSSEPHGCGSYSASNPYLSNVIRKFWNKSHGPEQVTMAITRPRARINRLDKLNLLMISALADVSLL
jgi:hypothetical protein